jgi:methyltransferase (TIGR00027 family)
MLARTAFFDDVVTQALKADIGQIVFLGAGYDSRPYRFTSLIAHTRIFELDAEPTQRRKRECLEHAQIQIPARVTFVPVDFETDDLGATLLQAGFEAGKQSLFVWEGVTYYLSAEAVDHMLAFVRRNSAAGSSIAFDYAALSDETLNEQAARQLREHLRGQHGDEPTKFGIPVGGLATFLAARGFEVREHLTASGMKQKYLGGQRTDLGDVPSLLCLVHTRVVGGK